MEVNKHNVEDRFEDFDRPYWEEPERHALVRENINGKEYYSMHQVSPVLMFKICEDFDYALRLSKKMIDHGVRVFETFEEFLTWHKAAFPAQW